MATPGEQIKELLKQTDEFMESYEKLIPLLAHVPLSGPDMEFWKEYHKATKVLVEARPHWLEISGKLQ
jgi:hypothetical protein